VTEQKKKLYAELIQALVIIHPISPIAADAVGRFLACKKSKSSLDGFWGAAELAQATLLSRDCKYLHGQMYWQS